MPARTHTKLVDAARRAIDAVHQDTTVDVVQTLLSLRAIREHVDELVDSACADVQARDDD